MQRVQQGTLLQPRLKRLLQWRGMPPRLLRDGAVVPGLPSGHVLIRGRGDGMLKLRGRDLLGHSGKHVHHVPKWDLLGHRRGGKLHELPRGHVRGSQLRCRDVRVLPSWLLRALDWVGLVCCVLAGLIAGQVGFGILLDLRGRLLCERSRLYCMRAVRHGFLLGRSQPQLLGLCREHVLVRWFGELLAVRHWAVLHHNLKRVLSTNRLPGWHLRHSQLQRLLSGHILCGGVGGVHGLPRRYLCA